MNIYPAEIRASVARAEQYAVEVQQHQMAQQVQADQNQKHSGYTQLLVNLWRLLSSKIRTFSSYWSAPAVPAQHSIPE